MQIMYRGVQIHSFVQYNYTLPDDKLFYKYTHMIHACVFFVDLLQQHVMKLKMIFIYVFMKFIFVDK